METKFEPEVILEYGERAELAQTAATPGYRHLHRIARAEVSKFIVSLINADESNEKQVVERFRLAKSAAQFYQGLTNRLQEEIMQYTQAPRATDKPIDLTEGMLDIGEISSQVDHLPNFLSEEADYL